MNPTKLKHDAIIEVVFEIRFSSEVLPEIIIGRLADRTEWKSFEKNPLLPLAEIPASVRRNDAALRYEPVLQLQDQKTNRLVRIGTDAISYHLAYNYNGWTAFKSELVSLIQWFYSTIEPTAIERLGLRYIDALRTDLHSIEGLSALNLSIKIGQNLIDSNVMLNYSKRASDNHIMTTRITSGDLVLGQLDKEVTVVTDIDIYTSEGPQKFTDGEMIGWLDEAHSYSKNAFFSLIPSEKLKELADE